LFALFSATSEQEAAAKISMDLLRQLAAGQLGAHLHADNYAAFLKTLAGFAHVAPSNKASERASDEAALVRGLQIVDVLHEVQAAVPNLIATSSLSPARGASALSLVSLESPVAQSADLHDLRAAWDAAWIPLLSAYAQLCLNPARELRQNAISSLQRTLLAPEILHNTDVDLTVIFERVFFPLLEELLKPQVFRRDPDGMGETRLRASALLCKVFLQYLTQLSERQGMHTMTELWLKILGYQDRFMHSGRRDQMVRSSSLALFLSVTSSCRSPDSLFVVAQFEAVPELLKNVLLVMNASNFLVPPSAEGRTPEQARLWDATFERIHPFLPELQRASPSLSRLASPPRPDRADLAPTLCPQASSSLLRPSRSPSPPPHLRHRLHPQRRLSRRHLPRSSSSSRETSRPRCLSPPARRRPSSSSSARP